MVQKAVPDTIKAHTQDDQSHRKEEHMSKTKAWLGPLPLNLKHIFSSKYLHQQVNIITRKSSQQRPYLISIFVAAEVMCPSGLLPNLVID